MTCHRPSQGLQLHVSKQKIACIGGAGRRTSSCARGLGEHAPAEVRLIMGRRHLEIRVPTNPVMRKKQRRMGCHSLRGIRFHDLDLRMGRPSAEKQKNEGEQLSRLQRIPHVSDVLRQVIGRRGREVRSRVCRLARFLLQFLATLTAKALVARILPEGCAVRKAEIGGRVLRSATGV